MIDSLIHNPEAIQEWLKATKGFNSYSKEFVSIPISSYAEMSLLIPIYTDTAYKKCIFVCEVSGVASMPFNEQTTFLRLYLSTIKNSSQTATFAIDSSENPSSIIAAGTVNYNSVAGEGVLKVGYTDALSVASTYTFAFNNLVVFDSVYYNVNSNIIWGNIVGWKFFSN